MDFLLLHLHGLHLVVKGNLELGKSILKLFDSTITGSRITDLYKNAVCSTDFNLNREDFPTLPCVVPACDSVCHLHEASFSKSNFEVVTSSSVP